MTVKEKLDQVVGSNIKLLRLYKGMSQRELGFHLGMSNASVSNIETGKYGLSLTSLLKLSQLFNIPADDLLKSRIKVTVS